MPHVLAMERAGLTFKNYFVTDSLCCPSRTSLFTGEFPHNDGVFRNTGKDGGFNAFLANGDQNRTFASALHSRGYQTGMFGKYLNEYEPEDTYDGQRPYIPPGWSAWDVSDKHGYGEYGYTLAVGHQLARYGSAPSDYLTSVLSTKASQFIAASAKANQPFMAEVATFAPHDPFVPAPQDASKFPGLQAPRTPAFGHAVRNAPGWLKAIPPLTASASPPINRAFRLRVQDVQSVDRMIGSLETRIRNLGISSEHLYRVQQRQRPAPGRARPPAGQGYGVRHRHQGPAHRRPDRACRPTPATRSSTENIDVGAYLRDARRRDATGHGGRPAHWWRS